jgi:hypothetical protein
MPQDCEVLADGEYDAIVLGTGLKECIMSGLLAVNGKKVRNKIVWFACYFAPHNDLVGLSGSPH